MKPIHLVKFLRFGISSVLFRRKDPILGTIILTDKCNLSCKHCAVNNINGIIHPYTQIRSEMNLLYKKGIRILFFCGGETFLWRDGERDIRYLVKEAKEMGFLIVNVVTNGTYLIDLPEADLILLSLDGDRYNHNKIRGNTFDKIISNVRQATSNNICIYMAINKINKDDIVKVSNIAKNEPNIRAISFNFHTPYKGTEELSLSYDNKKHCLEVIEDLINKGYPIFNLKSAFKYILNNSFKRPCYQCVVIENGKISTCGRCIDEEGLCSQCGYFFVVEYSLIFNGNIKVIVDMFSTYLRYV